MSSDKDSTKSLLESLIAKNADLDLPASELDIKDFTENQKLREALAELGGTRLRISDRKVLQHAIHRTKAGEPGLISNLSATVQTVAETKTLQTGGPKKVKAATPADSAATAVAPPPAKDKINTVEPLLEVEYKVVLCDRKLSAHQPSGEDKLVTTPTYVVLSLKQSDKAVAPYEKTARLECSKGDVEFFEDEKCTKAVDISKGFEAKKLDGKKLKLYVKAKTPGKFDLKLTLSDPANGKIKLDKNPSKVEMGAIELAMKLHQQDTSAIASIKVDPDTDPISTYHTNLKNKALPAQKEMTDEQKIKNGRLLHVQKSKSMGRAKLLLKKIDAGHLPAGVDNYEITINETNASGAAEIYDAEWEGKSVSLPIKIKVSDLKTKDREYWVQGKSATKKLRDVRLDAGLDRPAGGLAKTSKRNADWFNLTVVEFKDIKVDYKTPAGEAEAWDYVEQKFYINIKKGTAGRKVKIAAQLSEKIKDVTVHFMLAEDKDNRKAANWGVDMPTAPAPAASKTIGNPWKWKDISADIKHLDKKDRKDLLHLSAKTDANGLAKVELTLSRIGGDKFYPACYIDQDPHLAKYIHGHTDLEKKKPVFASDEITVWRRFWYQIVKVEGINVPHLGTAELQYDRVKAVMESTTELKVTKATVSAMSPRAIYPRYMIRVNGGNADALVVSDSNKAQFFTGYKAEKDKPVKVPILVCDAQWDKGGNSSAVNMPTADPASNFPLDLATNKLILNPPLQGGNLLVSGQWRAAEKDAAGNWVNVRSGNLSNGDLTINKTRSSLYQVTVNLPAGANPVTATTRVQITNLVVKGANGPYLGEYSPRTKRILAVYDDSTPLDIADFQNTIAHELGHAFHQVTKVRPAGIPAHRFQYDSQGSHCKYDTKKCVMYESGPVVGTLGRYCDVCHPYVLVQDMAELA